MQDRIAMVIYSLTKTFPVRVCEWLLAGLSISWGIAAWNHSDEEWANPIYNGLTRIEESQHAWGAIVCAIGILRMVALFRNGGWAPSPHLRAAGAFLACFAWLQISLGLFASPVLSTGIAIYPWLLAADIYNVFRASHDARLVDERVRVERRNQGTQEGAHAPGH